MWDRRAPPSCSCAISAEGVPKFSRLSGIAPDAFDPALSRALLMGPDVVGLALVRPVSANALQIDGVVLHPGFRGRWANVWLKHEAACAAMEAGMKTFVYDTYDEHRDSLQFATRVGGATVMRIEPYRMLGEAQEGNRL